MQTHRNSDEPVRIGISHGDFNGIGYEVILKTFSDTRIMEHLTPILYGQAKILSYYKKNFGLNDFTYNLIRDVRQAQPRKFNVINISDDEYKIECGLSTPTAGALALRSLQMAMNDIRDGNIDALVTAPINKENIQSEEFKFHGHTEFLTSYFSGHESLMFMVWDKLRIGTLTNHIPIADVAASLTPKLILDKLRVMKQSLRSDFGITMPKIAVLSLNPHAGDGGLLGQEENSVLVPTIAEANRQDILAFGPFPADGFFGAGTWRRFDAVLAMYHDQAMLPFKLLAMEEGVNYTAGLPIVRTSPAHGTAYDIANKNMASPDSFRHAIYLAVDVVRNRASL